MRVDCRFGIHKRREEARAIGGHPPLRNGGAATTHTYRTDTRGAPPPQRAGTTQQSVHVDTHAQVTFARWRRASVRPPLAGAAVTGAAGWR